MITKVLTANVPADVAERVEAYARSTQQSPSDVVGLAIERWAAWEHEKDRLMIEAALNCDQVGTIDDSDVGAWIESLGTEMPLPRPTPVK
ncbi:MAG: CopG family transcriptional regulator [Devosia sp.]|nr:CopG family transcriptional regulator [Devosia sp.]